MIIKNKTILITGGGSGIGLEIVKLLSAENRVVVVGRSKEKLESVRSLSPNISTIAADITDQNEVNKLVSEVNQNHSELSVLINNAGLAYLYSLSEPSEAFEKSSQEFITNLFAPINLVEKFLPLLKRQNEAAIVNVSSIVAFTPGAAGAGYSASKAALHSYTQSLRGSLAQSTAIKVYELMPPLVNTEFSAEIGGKERGMPAIDVAKSLLKGFEEDTYEIHVGQTKQFYENFFASSKGAYDAMNQKP